MSSFPVNVSQSDFRAKVRYIEAMLWFFLAGAISFFAYIVLGSLHAAYMKGDVLRSAILTFGRATPYIEFYSLAILSSFAAAPVLVFLDKPSNWGNVFVMALPFFTFAVWQFTCFGFDIFSLGVCFIHLFSLLIIAWLVSAKFRVEASLLDGSVNTYLYTALVISIFTCIPLLLVIVKSSFEKADYFNPVAVSLTIYLIIFTGRKRRVGRYWEQQLSLR